MHRDRLTRHSVFRKTVQFGALLATNLNLSGWVHGTIYTGASKAFPLPGLHCYSCPSSVLACPVGSLQSVLAVPGFWGALATGRPDALIVLGLLGFIALVGLVAGRFACGWFCPFGLVQELLYKIPLPKMPFHEALRPAKYAILLLFVMALPAFLRTVAGGAGDPWFCKVICPTGTAFAGWPLVSASGNEFEIGFLFWWKSAIALAVLLWAVTVERPFCRAMCPLGAAWGALGKVSLVKMHVSDACTACGKCGTVCPMGIEIHKNPSSAECIRCGRCIEVCPVNAISHSVGASK